MGITDTIAGTVLNADNMIIMVALAALAVAVGLSFISRIAFYVLGVAGTVGGLWVAYRGIAADGFSIGVLVLPLFILLGGWIAGFVVKSTIKFGAIVVTLFSLALWALLGWAARTDAGCYPCGPDLAWYGQTLMGVDPLWHYAGMGIIMVGLVLAIPTILGKTVKGAVGAVVPGGKKDKK